MCKFLLVFAKLQRSITQSLFREMLYNFYTASICNQRTIRAILVTFDCLYGIQLACKNVDISQHWIAENGSLYDVTMTPYTVFRNLPPSLMHIRNHYLQYWRFTTFKSSPFSYINCYRFREIREFSVKKHSNKSAIFSVKE